MKYFLQSIVSFVFAVCLTILNSNSYAFVKNERTVFTENFNNQSNEGAWSFAGSPTIVEDENKKSYLQVDGLDTWAPILRTHFYPSNPFLGNYRARNVIALSLETQWFNPNINPLDDRPMSIMLIHGNYAAYKTSSKPLQNAHLKWEKFEFSIPASSVELEKNGWKVIEWPQNSRAEADDSHFEEILNDVQQVRFYYANPTLFYYLQEWNVGVTNISIVRN